MNEYLIGYTAVGSLAGLAVGCLFYMLGGRDGKWKRRFVGSAIIATTLVICSLIMGKFNWWLPLTYVPLAVGFSLGYGADILWKKAVKRTIYFLAVFSSGLICCFSMGPKAWPVLPFQFFAGMLSIYLGLENPIQAAAEEVFVCAVLCLGLIMYPFIA